MMVAKIYLPMFPQTEMHEKCIFESILNEFAECLIATDITNNIVIANLTSKRNAKRLFGIELQAGLSLTVLPQEINDTWSTVLRSRQPVIKIPFASVSNEHCELSCYPLHDGNNQVIGAYGVFRFEANDMGDFISAQTRIKQQQVSNFETIAQHLPNLVWFCNPKGECFWMNNKYTLYTGVPLEEGQGRKWEAVIHPEDRQHTCEKFDESLQTGIPHEVRHRLKHKDGTWRWYVSRAEALRDKEGNIETWIGTSTDIEDVVQAQTKLSSMTEQLNLLMAAAHFGVWSWDMATEKVEVDDNLLELYGIDRKDFHNTRMELKEQVIAEDKIGVRAEIERAQREHDLFDKEFRTKNGRILAGRGKIFWDHEGKPCKMVGINWDITQKRKLEKERLKALEYAEEQARQRIQEAQEHHKRLEEFVDTICHEIRNPLNGICGMVSIMQSSIKRSSQTNNEMIMNQMKEGLETIEQCAQQQRVIADDVLDLSKVEHDKLELNPTIFNVKNLVETVLLVFQGSIKQKNHQLEIHLPQNANTSLKADSHRLSQILMNLLSNSIKFTENGSISLEVSQEIVVPEKMCKLNIAVSDTGIGMSPEEQARLFNKFTQAHNGIANRYGGSGLGLVISKKLVERMGGHFEVQSAKGKGTRFRFSIPCEIAQDSTPCATTMEEEWNLASLRVLIVEDNVINQKILVNYMNQQKCLCQVANNGLEAVNLCSQSKFDVIFMDLEMPIMGGLEATRKIREQQCLNHNTLIIGLSGNARQEHKEEAIKCGMDEYLTKPYHKTDIYKTVMRCFRGRRPCSGYSDAKRKRID